MFRRVSPVNCNLLMLNLSVGDGHGNMSEDDDDFYDAMSEQTEEIKIALPSSDKKAHQSVHFIVF